MTFLDLIRAPRRMFEAEGAGGAGGEGAGGEGAGAGAGGEGAGAGGEGGGAKKWYEAESYTAEERQWLTARGLAVDDPTSAMPNLIKGHRAAEQRLGRGLDTIMDRPAKDQDLTEWMRQNGEVFGLPTAEADYKIDRPADLPQGVVWNDDLAGQARKLAFEKGVRPDQLEAFVGLYTGMIGEQIKTINTEADAANSRMMEALAKDKGRELPAFLAGARQAAGVLAEKAGLDQAGKEGLTAVLSAKLGDAQTIKLFGALAEMMGEDSLVRGGGSTSLGMTPAEARQKAAQMRERGGEYERAVSARDMTTLQRLKPELERLDRLASGA